MASQSDRGCVQTGSPVCRLRAESAEDGPAVTTTFAEAASMMSDTASSGRVQTCAMGGNAAARATGGGAVGGTAGAGGAAVGSCSPNANSTPQHLVCADWVTRI